MYFTHYNVPITITLLHEILNKEISRNHIFDHLKRLNEEGLVQEVKEIDGKLYFYYLGDYTVNNLRKFEPVLFPRMLTYYMGLAIKEFPPKLDKRNRLFERSFSEEPIPRILDLEFLRKGGITGIFYNLNKKTGRWKRKK